MNIEATTLENIDASTLMLGFTGSIGSGCSYISKMLPIISLPKKYKYYKVSDVIKSIFLEEGVTNPNVPQLQDKGNELRRNNNSSYLIGLLLSKIDSEWDGDCGIIIDGIKNEGEVNILRQFHYFFIFSVQASKETRSERAIKAGRFSNHSEFDAADLRDQLEEYEYGQQVSRCSYLSDIIINNEANIPAAANEENEKFLRTVYHKYVKLIENLHESKKSLDSIPTIDEMCMTIAYALSKSSRCLKRKVGCIIVDVEIAEHVPRDDTHKTKCLPFLVSSGYNEVPLGSSPCVLNPEYQKCYRDYLQEEFAKTLKHCPACGEEIIIDVECPFCHEKHHEFLKNCKRCHKEIDFIFTCNGCGKRIFDTYLPGSKRESGKLLDMCRALHAEETALLKLRKDSGRTNNNLVLYATTQPCNLCSNKIVLSGIKKVIYSEPYSMKESSEILKSGRIEVTQFEGVKSSAFFRLYQ